MTPEQCRQLLDSGYLQAFAEGRLQMKTEPEPAVASWETVTVFPAGLPPEGELRIAYANCEETKTCDD